MQTVALLNRALGSRYRIERVAGTGGMATVYAATDLRHDRRVALKVLKPELAAVLGVERFLSEIRVTAALQHPNIVPLFDSGEADGMLFYVMPFVEGESLRARLDRERQLPVDDAIRIGSAVAAALHYAHERGVIHRDLKPENVLLQAGQPMVSDFGIALAVSAAGGQRITQTGLSLGTPQYMSPEQATGDRDLDARSDIYSLGAVVYEMLAGEPPHVGGTVQAVIARVVTERAPHVSAVRASVPASVDYAIDKALQKVPADRWSTAAAFADALQAKNVVVPRSGPRLRDPFVIAAGTLALLATATAAFLATRNVTPDMPLAALVIPALDAATFEPNAGGPIAVSPDGRSIVYVGRGQAGQSALYVRKLETSEPRALDGSAGAFYPVVSPDGRWVAFFSNTMKRLMKIPLDGGPPVELVPLERAGRITWPRPETIVFTSGGRLMSVSSNGGAPTVVLASDSAKARGQVQNATAFDDGSIVFAAIPRGGAAADAILSVTSLSGAPPRSLGIKALAALQVIDDYLIAVRVDGALIAVPFDRRRREVRGAPVVVRTGIGTQGYSVKAALSRTGTLAYSDRSQDKELLWVDDAGRMRPAVSDIQQYYLPRIAPDGKHVAVYSAKGRGSAFGHFWIYDIANATMTRLNGDSTAFYGEWSPDSKSFYYYRNSDSSVVVQAVDATTSAARVISGFHYIALHPGGRQIVYTVFPADGSTQYLATRALTGPDTTAHKLEGFPGELYAYRFSPDGQYLAYVSTESGRDEVYVRPFPGPGPRVQVSQAGGAEPVWSPAGDRIYYRADNGRMMLAAKVQRAPFRVLGRTKLFEGDFGFEWDVAEFDVSRATGELLMTRFARSSRDIQVVLSWQQELRERTQGRR